jgi:hypothetical protein
MPDTPALQETFGQPPGHWLGCGVPVARLLGLFNACTGLLLRRVVAPLVTHDWAQVQAVPSSVPAGEGLVADRGLRASAPLAFLLQARRHAGRRVGARRSVDVTPGRPFGTPRVRRTPAVHSGPRSRWRTALGIAGPLVTGLNPPTCPAGRTREALAALPAAVAVRAGAPPSTARASAPARPRS